MTHHEKKGLRGQNWIRGIFYNYAQPILINDKIYVIVTQIEYSRDDSLEAVHSPISQKFFVYSLENENLVKLKELTELADNELVFLRCVWKNRLFFYKQEPYPRVRILEAEVSEI